jgi:aspartyl aminopeptidase
MSNVRKVIPAQFLDFLNQTGSPYHSVLACKNLLNARGFKHLSERECKWDISRGGKYYITRNHSEIFAFIVGSNFSASSGGLVMVGAHTDSPCLRIRPRSNQRSEGFLRLGVAPYGGGLWYTWFDRPLGLAGKVVLRGAEERLVRIDRPVCLIPSLAIHLQSADERKAFDPNSENHLMPILCLAEGTDTKNDDAHSAELLGLIATELGCEPGDITDLDLCLFDTTPASVVGIRDEFVSGARLDNLLSTWASISALSEATDDDGAVDILVAASFDHEEVGSTSATGADSTTVSQWVDRILESLSVTGANLKSSLLAKSILVSADCAHGIHPNYPAKHQAEHKVTIGRGIVFKHNCNQRYATTPSTTALARSVCNKGDVKYQDFVVRNDSPCGSTIGPLLSAMLGVRTIDVGAPQWAMHSCRETAGVEDVKSLKEFCSSVYRNFRQVDNEYKEL